MTTKPTNPKDIIGSSKIPLHLFPSTAKTYGALGLLDGMLKYGRTNWRAAGIRTSIYYDAINRHLDAWFEGEDTDPDSGLPHLAHAIAGIAILIDGIEKANITDDRMYPSNYRETMTKLSPEVERIKGKHDETPHHWTIQDSIREEFMGYGEELQMEDDRADYIREQARDVYDDEREWQTDLNRSNARLNKWVDPVSGKLVTLPEKELDADFDVRSATREELEIHENSCLGCEDCQW